MRIPTEKKVRREKEKTEKSKIKNKETSGVKVKLSKKYTDNTDYNVDKANIKLSRIRAGIVRCCRLVEIRINGESVRIEESWIEAICRMIVAIYHKKGDMFEKDMLMISKGNEFKVCRDNFEIISQEIYRYKDSGEYVIKQLPSIGYYVRIRENEVNIIEVMARLATVYGEKLDNIEAVVHRKVKAKETNSIIETADEITVELEEIARLVQEQKLGRNK